MPQLPSYTAQTAPSVGPVGTTGEQPVNVTEGLTRGGMNLTKDLTEQQFKIDNIVSEETNNKFREYKTQRLTEFSLLQGEDAIKRNKETGLTPAEQMQKDLRDYQMKLSETVGGGAKSLFQLKSSNEMSHAEQVAVAHQTKSQKVYQDSVLKDSYIKNTQDLALYASDPAKVAELHASMVNNLRQLNSGLKADAIIADEVSKSSLQAVAGLVKRGIEVGDTTGPHAHLYAMMTEPDRAEALKLSKSADADAIALRVRQQVWYPGMTEESMSSVADSVAGENAPKHAAIMRQLRDADAGYKKDSAVYDSDFIGTTVSNMVTGKQSPSDAIRSATADLRLSDHARGIIQEHAERRMKSDNEDPRVVVKRYLAWVSDPGTASLSRDEALKVAGTLGPYAERAFSAWQSMSGPGAFNMPAGMKDYVLKRLAAQNVNIKDDDVIAGVDAALMQVREEVAESIKGKGKYAEKPPKVDELMEKVLLRATPRAVENNLIMKDKAVAPSQMTEQQMLNALSDKVIGREMNVMITTRLRQQGILRPTPADRLRTLDSIKLLKTENPALYNALYTDAFPPSTAATTRPMDRR